MGFCDFSVMFPLGCGEHGTVLRAGIPKGQEKDPDCRSSAVSEGGGLARMWLSTIDTKREKENTVPWGH